MNTKLIYLMLIFVLCAHSQRTQMKQGGRLIDFNFRSTADGSFETVNCHRGDRIRIQLEENPTTGYQWIIPEEAEGFNVIWSLESSDYQGSPNNGMMGVGGTRTFILDINDSGNEYLTFVYGRPWLYDDAIADFRRTGYFNAGIMEGTAIQLTINSS